MMMTLYLGPPPICARCVNFHGGETERHEDRCIKFYEVVRGRPLPCHVVRADPNMCGQFGRYFERREEQKDNVVPLNVRPDPDRLPST